MPEQEVTVNAYHPYPAFSWEFSTDNGGVWAGIEGYPAYVSGQGAKTVVINAIEGQEALLRCTVGPESAGVPVYGHAGTVTTDPIPVTVGALTWVENLPLNGSETIQTSAPEDEAPNVIGNWNFSSGARVDASESAVLSATITGYPPPEVTWYAENGYQTDTFEAVEAIYGAENISYASNKQQLTISNQPATQHRAIKVEAVNSVDSDHYTNSVYFISTPHN